MFFLTILPPFDLQYFFCLPFVYTVSFAYLLFTQRLFCSPFVYTASLLLTFCLHRVSSAYHSYTKYSLCLPFVYTVSFAYLLFTLSLQTLLLTFHTLSIPSAYLLFTQSLLLTFCLHSSSLFAAASFFSSSLSTFGSGADTERMSVTVLPTSINLDDLLTFCSLNVFSSLIRPLNITFCMETGTSGERNGQDIKQTQLNRPLLKHHFLHGHRYIWRKERTGH